MMSAQSPDTSFDTYRLHLCWSPQNKDQHLGLNIVSNKQRTAVIVSRLQKGSLAEAAGVRVSDYIVGADGRNVHNPIECKTILVDALRRTGKCQITILRPRTQQQRNSPRHAASPASSASVAESVEKAKTAPEPPAEPQETSKKPRTSRSGSSRRARSSSKNKVTRTSLSPVPMPSDVCEIALRQIQKTKEERDQIAVKQGQVRYPQESSSNENMEESQNNHGENEETEEEEVNSESQEEEDPDEEDDTTDETQQEDEPPVPTKVVSWISVDEPPHVEHTIMSDVPEGTVLKTPRRRSHEEKITSKAKRQQRQQRRSSSDRNTESKQMSSSSQT